MTDELDMIPAILYFSDATKRKYSQRKEPHLISVEYCDTDVMNVNIYGPKWDYQIQLKISSFLAQLKAEKILEGSN